MSSSEEVQSILDLKSWFTRASKGKVDFETASIADIQRLEKAVGACIPSSLKTLLQECNGGLYFMEKKQLSVVDIVGAVSKAESSRHWKDGLVPFCGDESSFLVIDTTRRDEICEFDLDDGLGDVISPNLLRYLENYRNDLLEGHFEFIEDVGVVEKTGKPHK